MNETIVDIPDLEMFAANLDELVEVWPEIARTSLGTALSNENIASAMQRRAPMSDPKRYNYYVRKSGQKVKRKHPPIMNRGNLRRSFRLDSQASSNIIKIGFFASTDMQYANAMHELPDPLPSGKPIHWSTPNTGNKFVQISIENNADWIPEETCKEIDAKLRRMGL